MAGTRLLMLSCPVSAAMNKGSAVTDPFYGPAVTTDQRGVTRPVDYLSVAQIMLREGEMVADIGAFELLTDPT